MSIISVPHARLPDQINVNFGPPELLGPAFLALDRAARQRGVYLSISHDLDELAYVNEVYRKDWYPLPPMFDPTLGGISEDNAFWIRGVNGKGEVVLSHACRMYVWPDTSLADELESMRFFYPEPETQRSPGEACIVASDAATQVFGRVCYSGAVWVRPDFRKLGLAHITPRLVRAYSLTHWYPDFSMGMVKTSAVPNAAAARTYGWRHVHTGIRWLGSREGGAELEFAFGWLDRDDVVADLEEFTLLLDEPVGALVV